MKKNKNFSILSLYMFNQLNFTLIPIYSIFFILILIIFGIYFNNVNNTPKYKNIILSTSNNLLIADGCFLILEGYNYKSNSDCKFKLEIKLSDKYLNEYFKINSLPQLYAKLSNSESLQNPKLLVDHYLRSKNKYINKNNLRYFTEQKNFGISGDCFKESCELYKIVGNNLKIVKNNLINDTIRSGKFKNLNIQYKENSNIINFNDSNYSIQFNDNLEFKK